MTPEERDRIHVLMTLLAEEKDYIKYLELEKELQDLLKTKEQRLKSGGNAK
jgi:hypothetical protein